MKLADVVKAYLKREEKDCDKKEPVEEYGASKKPLSFFNDDKNIYWEFASDQDAKDTQRYLRGGRLSSGVKNNMVSIDIESVSYYLFKEVLNK